MAVAVGGEDARTWVGVSVRFIRMFDADVLLTESLLRDAALLRALKTLAKPEPLADTERQIMR